MNRRQLIVLVACTVAFLTAPAISARTQFLYEGQAEKVSDQIDQLEDAGLSVKNMFFFQELGLNKAASDRLRMYRVMTREDWTKLSPEEQATKMAELRKDNPNVYVCFPVGDIYSIPNEKFITFLYKISDWPEDFLEYDEERDFYNAREARLRPDQPPKEIKPQSRTGGQAAEGEHEK